MGKKDGENFLFSKFSILYPYGGYEILPEVEKHARESPSELIKKLASKVGTEILIKNWQEVLLKEHQRYEENRSKFEEEYPGKWIALYTLGKKNKIITADSLDSLVDLIYETQKKEGRFQAYVCQVGKPPEKKGITRGRSLTKSLSKSFSLQEETEKNY